MKHGVGDIIKLGYAVALPHGERAEWGALAPMTFGKWRIVIISDDWLDIVTGY